MNKVELKAEEYIKEEPLLKPFRKYLIRFIIKNEEDRKFKIFASNKTWLEEFYGFMIDILYLGDVKLTVLESDLIRDEENEEFIKLLQPKPYIEDCDCGIELNIDLLDIGDESAFISELYKQILENNVRGISGIKVSSNRISFLGYKYTRSGLITYGFSHRHKNYNECNYKQKCMLHSYIMRILVLSDYRERVGLSSKENNYMVLDNKDVLDVFELFNISRQEATKIFLLDGIRKQNIEEIAIEDLRISNDKLNGVLYSGLKISNVDNKINEVSGYILDKLLELRGEEVLQYIKENFLNFLFYYYIKNPLLWVIHLMFKVAANGYKEEDNILWLENNKLYYKSY